MSKTTTTSRSNQIITFDIDSQANVSQVLADNTTEATLDNTLLALLYPDIKVAMVQVPTGFLDPFEESAVANAMAAIKTDDVEYRLIGGNGSAKDGKFYLVDAAHSQVLGQRFQFWPEAAIVSFGILVSPCRVVMDEPKITVLVVEDHKLGTNDSRGWIRRSLFDKLQQKHRDEILNTEKRRLAAELYPDTPLEDIDDFDLTDEAEKAIARKLLRPDAFYQFRLALENAQCSLALKARPIQAKGGFKVMEDHVADLLKADVVLPKSSVKPELDIPAKLAKQFATDGARFEGRIVLGVRDVSEVRTYASSYQLIENAPEDSIQLEIVPEALKQARAFAASLEKGDYAPLLELLGLEDPETLPKDQEVRILEAALIADTTGCIVRHPYVINQLNKILATWAFKTATGGGLRLPGFALIDDGYLFAHEDYVFAGSDWIPKHMAIAQVTSRRGLCVRYPIRSADDLLPMQHLNLEEVIDLLQAEIEQQGCGGDNKMAREIVSKQLLLEGTYVLHSETASKNGGDFDFDGICVVEEDRFPRFVADRFSRGGSAVHQGKTKVKNRSPWWNLPFVAMKARGNDIGRITDLKSSCVAAGQMAFAQQLVGELQNALDSLKWNVHPDREVIDTINKQVVRAPWLQFKRTSTISKLPMHLDVAETDRIGKIYNLVRKEIPDLSEIKAPIAEFKMLVGGEDVNRQMFDECRLVNNVYGTVWGRISERQERLSTDYEKACAEWDEVRHDANRTLRQQKYEQKQKAFNALKLGEERVRKEMRAVLMWIRLWAVGKQDNRMGWVQALQAVACGGKGSGAILFHAFPQELVNRLAERGGGRALRVQVPDLQGFGSRTDAEGRTFLIEPVEGGVKERLLFRILKNSEIIPATMD